MARIMPGVGRFGVMDSLGKAIKISRIRIRSHIMALSGRDVLVMGFIHSTTWIAVDINQLAERHDPTACALPTWRGGDYPAARSQTMNAEWLPFWATVIVALIGSIPALLRLSGQHHNDRADALDKQDQVIARQSDRLDEQAKDIDDLRKEIVVLKQQSINEERLRMDMEARIERLENQVRALGAEPVQ